MSALLAPRDRALSAAAILAAVATFSTGCATASQGSHFSEGEERGSSTEIVSSEIRAVEASYHSARDVIRHLRPAWLRIRSAQSISGPTEPVVHLDGIRYGGLESLYRIDTSDIEQMVYVSGLDATTLFGTGYGGGVILIDPR